MGTGSTNEAAPLTPTLTLVRQGPPSQQKALAKFVPTAPLMSTMSLRGSPGSRLGVTTTPSTPST